MKMPWSHGHAGLLAGVRSPRGKTRSYKNRNIINTSKQRGTGEGVKMLSVFYFLLPCLLFLFFPFSSARVAGSLCEVPLLVFYRSFDFSVSVVV